MHGTHILFLVCDGIFHPSYRQARLAFESSHAHVFLTAPEPFDQVRAFLPDGSSELLSVDMPLDAVRPSQFQALVVPDGVLSADLLRRDRACLSLLRNFHEKEIPVCVSGEALRILHDSGILSRHILVHDTGSFDAYVSRIRSLLTGGPDVSYGASQDPFC